MPLNRSHGRDAPRSWLSLFWRLGGWIALLAGFLLLVLTFVSSASHREAAEFEALGEITAAEILNKREEVTRDSDGDRVVTYFVTYRFQAPGEQVIAETRVGRGLYRRSEPANRQELRYLPDSPRTFEVPPGSTRRGAWQAQLLALALGLGALAGLWFPGRRAVRAVKTRRSGSEIHATVTEVVRTNVKVNKRQQGYLAWEEPGGATGRSLYRGLEWLNDAYSPGDEIVVYRRGDDSWWEGDVGPAARVPPSVPSVK
ncbi:MAG: DUF3592 domain-containing protein [Pseudomonadota bacterium]